ncbi:MAG: deoxyguanosinetriphosphate triphosphohydrolase [Prolixibacteraceae bacterium]|jgi:dGTPase|nr:deoxyguanosinetriphosphate triphosphohydrolase [Prolixibacteraceae bacterium]
MTKWSQLISPLRLGFESKKYDEPEEIRTAFQRDYDRIIFSSPFRRLQNKTQVFPLPGSIFVHNRLTHSLEVASVGRSLGNLVALGLAKSGEGTDANILSEIGTIVSTACLAHDMGNPPFGHSGENAISIFFRKGNGKILLDQLPEEQKTDFTCFDGNANAFRLLTHTFNGRREGGFGLTYSTLAAVVKYPYESVLAGDKQKFGFFQTEKELFYKIALQLGLHQRSDRPLRFSRHPLVFLVEAADDICYQIIDLEDAHKLKIITSADAEQMLLAFFDQKDDKDVLSIISDNLRIVQDKNERVGYLRAMVIGKLVKECAAIFLKNMDRIKRGEATTSLLKMLEGNSKSAMGEIKRISVSKIYKDPAVIQIEIAGYKILGTLLEEFTPAIIDPEDALSEKLLSIIPQQYHLRSENLYEQLQTIVDFVSGMTDLYALDLYRKITGMNLPGV